MTHLDLWQPLLTGFAGLSGTLIGGYIASHWTSQIARSAARDEVRKVMAEEIDQQREIINLTRAKLEGKAL